MINTLTLAMSFVSQFRVPTHARGNGLSYCVLAHAAECKHSFGAVLKRTSMKRTLLGYSPQRAKHAIKVKQKWFEKFQVFISSGFAWACCARWVSTLISVN